MRRRRPDTDPVLSLDSFLDIVTNVVGVLILIAVVTVISAGDIGVSSGASVMTAPRNYAARIVFECRHDTLYFVDEKGNAELVRTAAAEVPDAWPTPDDFGTPKSFGAFGNRMAAGDDGDPREQTPLDRLIKLLDDKDVGDSTHRVTAKRAQQGIAWIYTLRDRARGTTMARLGKRNSEFQKKLDWVGRDGYVYFVVHDDSFEVFREAREIAHKQGVSVGWHPVEGDARVVFSGSGTLGKRTQ